MHKSVLMFLVLNIWSGCRHAALHEDHTRSNYVVQKRYYFDKYGSNSNGLVMSISLDDSMFSSKDTIMLHKTRRRSILCDRA